MVKGAMATAGGVCKLVYCGDELTPSNPRRPDTARQLYCLYWVCANWSRRWHDMGWLPLGFIKTSILNDIPGGISAILSQLVSTMCTMEVGKPSFHVGFRCALRENGEMFDFRADIAGFLSDQKALKEFYCVKAATETKISLECKNLVSFNPPAGDDYLCSLSAPLNKTDPNRKQRIYAMVDHLKNQRAVLNKGSFKRLQQDLGLNFVPTGLLFNDSLRVFLDPVAAAIWDSTH